MKNEIKAIITLGSVLLVSLLANAFLLRPTSTDGSLYAEINSELRKTSELIEENYNRVRKELVAIGDVQGELEQLQLEHSDLIRQREEDTRRREALESTARDINTAFGDTLDGAFNSIDSFYEQFESLGGSID